MSLRGLRIGAAAFAAVIVSSLSVARDASAAGTCDPGWGWCPDRLGGGCAPVNSTCCPGGTHVPKGQQCPADTRGSYGAVAVSMWNDNSGQAHVATGISWDWPFLSSATEDAMNRCKSSGGTTCQVVGTFKNGGCGYVATGHNERGVRYGMGATPNEAYDECSTGGYTCKTPIGGCTKAR